MNLPGTDTAHLSDCPALTDLETACLLELLAEHLDRDCLQRRLEALRRHPVVGECVAVAEPARHPAWGEGAQGLHDGQEERLPCLPLLLRVDDDLHLGEVEVAEELLRDEVRERVVLHQIIAA